MPFDATPVSNDLIEKLEQMLKLFERPNGWIQRRASDGVGYCLLGAASKVGLNVKQAGDALGFGACDGGQYVVSWNDSSGRHKQEVLDRVKTAIDRERERLLLSR